MATLMIVVPSFGRPENAHRLQNQIRATTSTLDHVCLTFAVEEKDPRHREYPSANTDVVTGGNMVQALNEAAVEYAATHDYLAFLGDDTLPHSGWYAPVMEALQAKKNSIVYGNDLFHGEGLPTSVFMDANIVRTLGYMAPPNQKQLFVDNYWKSLGEQLGTLTYLNHVVIEHLHPHFGKSASDALYDAAYSGDRWSHDEQSYHEHMQGQFLQDLEKLK